MVEGAGGLRLLLEPAEPIRIGRRLRGQDLDRYLPPEPLVARAVDLPHPARAERAENLVRAETRPALDHGASQSRAKISWTLKSRSVITESSGALPTQFQPLERFPEPETIRTPSELATTSR